MGDAFSNAALIAWLSETGAKHVILLGAQTDQYVTATVEGAMNARVGVMVLSDTHSTWDLNGETTLEIIARQSLVFAHTGLGLVTSDTLTRS